ncbi:hypothetical protein Q8A73_016469 [Channa argus]|nr:hypothetical protein Q8A73_016469 [Channa argus]
MKNEELGIINHGFSKANFALCLPTVPFDQWLCFKLADPLLWKVHGYLEHGNQLFSTKDWSWQYLVEKICTDGAARGFTLAFVWNRNPAKLKGLVPDELILTDLSAFAERQCDVIVEVCHPQIVKEFGPHFLSQSHFMVGSPSALSDPDLNQKLRQAACQYKKTLYIPSGALWGGQDIQRLNDSGALRALFIRMSKHPSCFRLTGDLLSDWAEGEGRRVLFKGSVAELCPLAPNNVNTMAAAAVAAGTLGFTGVQGEIVSDTALSDYHVVEVEVTGPDGFSVHTVRRNPAKLGAVTGSATYSSFWNSLLCESCTFSKILM